MVSELHSSKRASDSLRLYKDSAGGYVEVDVDRMTGGLFEEFGSGSTAIKLPTKQFEKDFSFKENSFRIRTLRHFLPSQ